LSAERTASPILIAPVAAAGWVVLVLTDGAVRIALLRHHRTPGLVSAMWGLGFGLFLWAGVIVLGVPQLRAILFALVAGGAIALVVYARGAALDGPEAAQPGAFQRRLLARRRARRASPASARAGQGRSDLDQARIEVARSEFEAAVPPLQEAERVAVAQRKLDELLEVRQLARRVTTRSSGHTRDAAERLAEKVDEQLQTFPAEELAAVGIRKEPSREEIAERFAREQLEAPADARVTTPELTLARTALESGDLDTALYHLDEARRMAVAQRRLEELLEVNALARVVSERSEGRTHAASARLIRKVETGVRSFAPAT
jgi:hypothetical protein